MRKARAERAQILPIVALALVVLLSGAALSIDVGYAYYAKRQLQAATDAAALAGAQDLPNTVLAIQTAGTYATANTPTNLSAFNFTYQTRCTATAILATGCNAAVNPNSLVVNGTASTHTWFGKIFGIDHFDVSAHANACSPCSSTPVDIVVAIDRTGSMCDSTDSNGCIDLNNAKSGVHTMLSMLSSPYAQVGMVAFPPLATATTSVCSAPPGTSSNYTAYDSTNRRYLTDQIGSDYKNADGSTNWASGLYVHTARGTSSACIRADGYTSYSEALRQAKAELDAHGRPRVPDYIVFLTDGEANIGSVYGVNSTYPPGNVDDQQPCQSAETVADGIKSAGVTIYSIGYALGSATRCTAGKWPRVVTTPANPGSPATYKPNGTIKTPAVPATPEISRWCDPALDGTCAHNADDHNESPAITSVEALTDIASPGNFYNKPAAGQLNTIFAAIATDISSGSSRLVDDGY